VAIAAGLTALLLWQSDPKAVWQAARGADWRFIVLACVLVAIESRADGVSMVDAARASRCPGPT
jgi:uncharacterized membrane protein YbhN (UPF0104 family)